MLFFYKEADDSDSHNQTFVISEVAHWDSKRSFEKTKPIAILETNKESKFLVKNNKSCIIYAYETLTILLSIIIHNNNLFSWLVANRRHIRCEKLVKISRVSSPRPQRCLQNMFNGYKEIACIFQTVI